jgi:hypothetical protein
VAVGLYANRYIRNMSDYVVAGRSLKSKKVNDIFVTKWLAES